VYSGCSCIHFFTKLIKENQPKKNRNAINALRDAELMRINTELSNKPYINVPYPAALTTEKIKRLKDKVASFEFKYIDMSDPMKLGEYKKRQYYIPSGENKNRWLEHVKKCMQEHPEYT